MVIDTYIDTATDILYIWQLIIALCFIMHNIQIHVRTFAAVYVCTHASMHIHIILIVLYRFVHIIWNHGTMEL